MAIAIAANKRLARRQLLVRSAPEVRAERLLAQHI
jgi:hypothetical protein